jgi:regulatory protein
VELDDDLIRAMEAVEAAATSDAPKNTARTLKTRAVYYLSKREYSRSELAKKLATPTFLAQKNALLHHTELPEPPTLDEINAVLDDLQRQGFLNDARFASSVVKRQAVKHGAARVLASLSQHKLDSAVTAQLAAELKDTELDRCYTVWAKKFDRSGIDNNNNDNNNDDADDLSEALSYQLSHQDKQAAIAKQGRFLMQRGFSPDAVRKVLNGWRPERD